MAELRIRILGCGSSGGVPRIGGHWGACDPANPKNTRKRCSILVERIDDEGKTSVLIDTTPDLRQQMLDAEVSRLDAVLYTHPHADHLHGIDDLRQIVINMRQRLPVWADPPTQDHLISSFGYAFIQPEGSPYPPILDIKTIDGPVTIEGDGGPITFNPIIVDHGAINALGFKIGPVVYTPDIKEMTEEAWDAVNGTGCWIVDALRRDPHPTHIHLDGALEWIEKAQPKHAVLTNMHIDLDYETVRTETPDRVEPAYDGLTLVYEVV